MMPIDDTDDREGESAVANAAHKEESDGVEGRGQFLDVSDYISNFTAKT
jgi:hypothetical protein